VACGIVHRTRLLFVNLTSTVTGDTIDLAQMLIGSSGKVVHSMSTVYAYRIIADCGYTPCDNDNLHTSACCKPSIQRFVIQDNVEVCDWVRSIILHTSIYN